MILASDILRLPVQTNPRAYLVLVACVGGENIYRAFAGRKPMLSRVWVDAATYAALKPPFTVMEARW